MSLRSSLAAAPRLADFLKPEANSFGLLRFVMATLVLVSHSYLYSAGTSAAEPLQLWLGRSLGEYAVQVFFILSGIMVAQSFDRSRGIADFAVARILRIFPALIVCVLVTAVVLGPMVSRLSPQAYFAHGDFFGYVAKTLSLSTGAASLPGVFETLPYAGFVNSSLWTLKYEVLCYAGLALLGSAGLLRERFLPVAAVALALLVATVSLTLPDDVEDYGFIENFRYFIVFFGSGVLAYMLRRHLPVHGAIAIALLGLFAASLDTPFVEVGSALFLGYGSLWAATKRWGPLRAMCNQCDASFGVYIYAGPTQQTLLWLVPSLTPLWLSLSAFAIVAPVAILSWFYIEKPALSLRTNFVALMARRSRPAIPLA